MTEPAIARNRRLDWLFPLLLLLPLGWTMWTFSGPGVLLLQMFAGLAVLAVFGVIWLVLVLVYTVRRNRRALAWYGVAAVLTMTVILMVVLQLPLHARWAVSRPAFDRLAVEMAADPDATRSGWIGAYEITHARRVNGGWIFYEANGNLFDDAGFAYLPSGPTDDLGDGSWEDPRFVHLGGPWYSWTASW